MGHFVQRGQKQPEPMFRNGRPSFFIRDILEREEKPPKSSPDEEDRASVMAEKLDERVQLGKNFGKMRSQITWKDLEAPFKLFLVSSFRST